MIAAVLYVVLAVLRMLEMLVLARVVASWLGADRRLTVVRVIYETTEPVLALVRPWTSKVPGPLDWAPWLVLVLIEAARILLFSVFG